MALQSSNKSVLRSNLTAGGLNLERKEILLELRISEIKQHALFFLFSLECHLVTMCQVLPSKNKVTSIIMILKNQINARGQLHLTSVKK